MAVWPGVYCPLALFTVEHTIIIDILTPRAVATGEPRRTEQFLGLSHASGAPGFIAIVPGGRIRRRSRRALLIGLGALTS